MKRHIAKIMVLITIAVWLVVDLWLYYIGSVTVSQLLWEWNRVSAALTLIAGILIGHWFFPASNEKPRND